MHNSISNIFFLLFQPTYFFTFQMAALQEILQSFPGNYNECISSFSDIFANTTTMINNTGNEVSLLTVFCTPWRLFAYVSDIIQLFRTKFMHVCINKNTINTPFSFSVSLLPR